jgi:hypothetical protein
MENSVEQVSKGYMIYEKSRQETNDRKEWTLL